MEMETETETDQSQNLYNYLYENYLYPMICHYNSKKDPQMQPQKINNMGVTVNVISPSQVNKIIKFLKRRAFKKISRKNNIRGIEFSEMTLNLLKYFCKSIRFKADVFSRLLDPIDKRLYKLT